MSLLSRLSSKTKALIAGLFTPQKNALKRLVTTSSTKVRWRQPQLSGLEIQHARKHGSKLFSTRARRSKYTPHVGVKQLGKGACCAD